MQQVWPLAPQAGASSGAASCPSAPPVVAAPPAPDVPPAPVLPPVALVPPEPVPPLPPPPPLSLEQPDNTRSASAALAAMGASRFVVFVFIDLSPFVIGTTSVDLEHSQDAPQTGTTCLAYRGEWPGIADFVKKWPFRTGSGGRIRPRRPPRDRGCLGRSGASERVVRGRRG